jgi:hypothetical protein
MKFSPLILCAALLVTASPNLSARLWESLTICTKRYGTPTSGPDSHTVVSADGSHHSFKKYGFSKAGLNIQVLIRFESDERIYVDKITYTKIDGTAFNASEVEILLSKNGDGSWLSSKEENPTVSKWQAGDGSHFAKLDAGTSLSVWTRKWDDLSKAELDQPTERQKAEDEFEGL